MMLRGALFLSAVLALGGALAGCNNKTTTPTDAGTDSGPADSGMMDSGPVMDSGPIDAANDGPLDAGPVDSGLSGACTNTADLGIQTSQDLSTITQTCGTMCVLGGMSDPCTSNCIVSTTAGDGGTGLSMGCADCYQAVFDCIATHCASDCTTNPTSTACIDCRCGRTGDMVDCEGMFTTCSGVPTTTCM